MDRPVIVLLDDEESTRESLRRELESRYGTDYRVVACASPEACLTTLADLRSSGVHVPLVLADQWMPDMTGIEFLARTKELVPTARRGLLITWGDRAASQPILEGAALGQMDFYLPKPAWSPDEQFHRGVTEALAEWWSTRGGRFEAVTVVADDPSARSHGIRDILTRNRVPFGFLRSDSDAGRATLALLGVEDPSGPVVALFNGVVLVDPTNAQVAAALGLDVRPGTETYDVVIVGAGPAGLAAGVYASSEGLRTAMLEVEAFGGQAGTSSMIRNYLGFPRGVSGVELASRAYEQAWIFGADVVYGNPAVSLAREDGLHVVRLADESTVRARAVVIATGMSYRRLDVPALEALVGAGVFYGAATAEAQAVAGEDVLVVGGGNSAGQAALHLAMYARHVTILVRSRTLAASMSHYLIREIDAAPNVDVRFGVEVVGGGGDGRLQYVEVRDKASDQVTSTPAAGLFVLIGAVPYSDWLPTTIERDDWGYVLTGPDLGQSRPGTRMPFLLETSLPGVFAIGDVRHGSMKRVAAAVGDGSTCIRLVHEYLALEPRPTDGGPKRT